ncbi:MAG: hypothetical protein OSJ68_08790, partial [Clostridia bacterium]|nr:hypothetical protein [Clostridia bacterium]
MKSKIIALLLVALTLGGMCLVIAGCTDEPTVYDVPMKVIYSDPYDRFHYWPTLGEWIFEPGVDEMHIELAYDGKEYRFSLFECFLPVYSNASKWVQRFGEVYYSLTKDGEPKDSERQYVCEKGEYELLIIAFCSK